MAYLFQCKNQIEIYSELNFAFSEHDFDPSSLESLFHDTVWHIWEQMPLPIYSSLLSKQAFQQCIMWSFPNCSYVLLLMLQASPGLVRALSGGTIWTYLIFEPFSAAYRETLWTCDQGTGFYECSLKWYQLHHQPNNILESYCFVIR